MKNLQCKLTRKRWMEIGVSVLLFVLIIAWALVLEYTEPDREATARASGILLLRASRTFWTTMQRPRTGRRAAASASSILRLRF